MTTPDDVFADPLTRHQMRLDRQARVGILRNLREPPRLPPRKAPLTGKWLDMRSRRRLRRQGLEPGVLGPIPDVAVASLPRTAEALGAETDGPGSILARPNTADAEAASRRGARGALRDTRLRFLAGLLAGLVLAALGAMAAAWIFAPAG